VLVEDKVVGGTVKFLIAELGRLFGVDLEDGVADGFPVLLS
jgi:hypothetical protein